jgi:hypothetical protein
LDNKYLPFIIIMIKFYAMYLVVEMEQFENYQTSGDSGVIKMVVVYMDCSVKFSSEDYNYSRLEDYWFIVLVVSTLLRMKLLSLKFSED